MKFGGRCTTVDETELVQKVNWCVEHDVIDDLRKVRDKTDLGNGLQELGKVDNPEATCCE